jgi:putative transcriptional regulator
MVLNEEELLARDAKRDIGAELLQAIREVKTNGWARKTEFITQADGTLRRIITRRD